MGPMAADNIYNIIDPIAGAFGRTCWSTRSSWTVSWQGNLQPRGIKELGCATGTMKDYGPDFGVPLSTLGMLDLMGKGVQR